jgi:ribosomal protein S18 acetylase RimI-like enzyme
MSVLSIIHAESSEFIPQVKALFSEYAETLDFALCFQDFNHELEELPGEYARPDGAILLALFGGEIAGCVAIRPIEEGICELKRLYVKPPYRGKGIGRRLTEEIIEEARLAGYSAIRLDTVPSMIAANTLYTSLGFTEIEPYRHNPIDGALYLELTL